MDLVLRFEFGDIDGGPVDGGPAILTGAVLEALVHGQVGHSSAWREPKQGQSLDNL